MAKKIVVTEFKDLKAWEMNPRSITPRQQEILKAGIQEYGDMGGIVFNVRLKRLVGGHQRTEVLKDTRAKVTITERLAKPSPTGTVAIGYVDLEGERFSYREVDWDAKKHAGGALMANKAGGDWDYLKVRELITELDDGQANLPIVTGFDLDEIENLVGSAPPPPPPDATSRDKNPEERAESHENSAIKKIEVWVHASEYPELIELLQRLGKVYGLDNNSEILVQAARDADGRVDYGPEN